ncbi:MAG: hypothetical protein ACI8UO_001928 [Verrucomicrobiales bacterium]|jgi:hypothetical protein
MTFDAVRLCNATISAEGVTNAIDPRSPTSAREVPRQARDDNLGWRWQIETELEIERHPLKAIRRNFHQTVAKLVGVSANGLGSPCSNQVSSGKSIVVSSGARMSTSVFTSFSR